MFSFLRFLLSNQEGASRVEYWLLIALIALVAVTAIQLLGLVARRARRSRPAPRAISRSGRR